MEADRSITQVIRNKKAQRFIEFLAATMEKSVYMKEEKLYMAFKMFDLDGSGKISAKELK